MGKIIIERLAKTGFIVSVFSYLVFFLADVIKPGFVSNYMSVHWWLLASVLFAIVWAIVLDKRHDHPNIQFIISVLLGIITAIVAWKTGEDLAEFRVLVTIIAAILPMTVLAVLRSGD